MTEQMPKRYPQSRYAKVIGEYCYRAIERVKESCEKKVNQLYEKFPYDGFAGKKLYQLLNREHIYEGQGCYADCVSAGMLAYCTVSIAAPIWAIPMWRATFPKC